MIRCCRWAAGAAALLTLTTACDRGYTETGDLPALQARGQLRVLAPRRGEVHVLPRYGHPYDHEQQLAAAFADSLGLAVETVWVDEYEDLIPALLAGRGDLIVANLSVTPSRAERIAFSEPVAHVREQVVTRLEDAELRAPADLAGRRVVVRRSSSFWPSVEALVERHPGIELVAAPENLDTEEILHRVATGAFDVTVADDNLVTEVLAYTPELRVAFTLTDDRAVAWGLRPEATDLLSAVNAFLARANVGAPRPAEDTDDLPGIRERGVLRVLTRNNATTYYVWRGRLVGFEYDLARRFADRLGLRLEIIVAPTRAALLTWLVQGRGDLVAAGLTITERHAARNVLFTRPYNHVREIVVGRPSDSALTGPDDLEGRTIAVRQSSSYWGSAVRLKASGVDLNLVAAPESLETAEIIGRVAEGDYDLTITDSHILDVELAWRDDVVAAFPVGDSVAHGWAVRSSNPRLKAEIDRYFHDEYRGLFYNITYRKYFTDPVRIRQQVTERVSRTGQVSPYDDLIQRYATRYGFDWRLIAAQMFEESRFDPMARSFAGALGLMQVLPSTGRQLGFDSLTDPEVATHAGIKFLRSLHERIRNARTGDDRLWFALAAYNAGYGHLMDGRRLARQLGRDPEVWFGEVERVMPLLAREQYHQRARFGYCRCSEPVKYVRRIRDRYQAYREVTGDDAPPVSVKN